MSDWDGLHICETCGDAYTTGRLCRSCAEQEMIDNDAEPVPPVPSSAGDLTELRDHWESCRKVEVDGAIASEELRVLRSEADNAAEYIAALEAEVTRLRQALAQRQPCDDNTGIPF